MPDGEFDDDKIIEYKVIEIPDMDYYRRRSPSEKPKEYSLVLAAIDGHITSARVEKGINSDELYFTQGNFLRNEVAISCCKWWAYAYIPEK